jgi:hypothetical protein
MKDKKLRNYWTKEKCIKESLKYKTKNEFSDNSSRAYQLCLSNNWFDLIPHLQSISYTKDYCISESKKYNTLKELLKNNAYLYRKILDNNWNEEMFSHFIPTGNKYKRCIYVYIFSDNYVYVGLTYNLDIRNSQHIKKGPVFDHSIKTKLIPKLTQLTDYLDINIAKNKEYEYVEYYKNNNYTILNSSKTGGIGSNFTKWTKIKCQEEALKYSTRTEYLKNSSSYYSAQKHNWLNDICKHMYKKPQKYWTYKTCLNEAKDKKTKSNFRKSITAYKIATINGWLCDIYSEMNWKEPQKSKNYWNNYDNCLNEAKKYKTSTEFIKKASYVYKHITKNNLKEKLYSELNWKLNLKHNF